MSYEVKKAWAEATKNLTLDELTKAEAMFTGRVLEANVKPDGSFCGPEDKEFVNIFEKY